jgi:hypothetical protein
VPAKDRRQVVAVKLSEESYAALMAYAEASGTTLAAMLEAFGQVLANTPPEGLPKRPDWLAEIIDDSRKIAAERRRRR